MHHLSPFVLFFWVGKRTFHHFLSPQVYFILYYQNRSRLPTSVGQGDILTSIVPLQAPEPLISLIFKKKLQRVKTCKQKTSTRWLNFFIKKSNCKNKYELLLSHLDNWLGKSYHMCSAVYWAQALSKSKVPQVWYLEFGKTHPSKSQMLHSCLHSKGHRRGLKSHLRI